MPALRRSRLDAAVADGRNPPKPSRARAATSQDREFYAGTPFRFTLRNEFAGRAGKIMRLAQDGRVVRAYPRWTDRDTSSLKAYTQKLLRDGIQVPKFDLVRAPLWGSSRRHCLYVVLEPIAGERLDEVARPTRLDWLLPVPKLFYERFYRDLDEFISNLFTHYENVMEDGGLVFVAMDQSQFMYGRGKSAKLPAIYFVDLDPTYSVVKARKDRDPAINQNDSKTDFEKPLNLLFEMMILHPEASLPKSMERAKEYFRRCSCLFSGFYSREHTPWWARSPNFMVYQRMKRDIIGD